ncbi:unnamed protein product [Amoebophrya sp. A25]|nr:unnamed protein product [Amoebophrya sp. A25]|eukprot:GSA25T00010065001.1
MIPSRFSSTSSSSLLELEAQQFFSAMSLCKAQVQVLCLNLKHSIFSLLCLFLILHLQNKNMAHKHVRPPSADSFSSWSKDCLTATKMMNMKMRSKGEAIRFRGLFFMYTHLLFYFINVVPSIAVAAPASPPAAKANPSTSTSRKAFSTTTTYLDAELHLLRKKADLLRSTLANLSEDRIFSETDEGEHARSGESTLESGKLLILRKIDEDVVEETQGTPVGAGNETTDDQDRSTSRTQAPGALIDVPNMHKHVEAKLFLEGGGHTDTDTSSKNIAAVTYLGTRDRYLIVFRDGTFRTCVIATSTQKDGNYTQQPSGEEDNMIQHTQPAVVQLLNTSFSFLQEDESNVSKPEAEGAAQITKRNHARGNDNERAEEQTKQANIFREVLSITAVLSPLRGLALQRLHDTGILPVKEQFSLVILQVATLGAVFPLLLLIRSTWTYRQPVLQVLASKWLVGFNAEDVRLQQEMMNNGRGWEIFLTGSRSIGGRSVKIEGGQEQVVSSTYKIQIDSEALSIRLASLATHERTDRSPASSGASTSTTATSDSQNDQKNRQLNHINKPGSSTSKTTEDSDSLFSTFLPMSPTTMIWFFLLDYDSEILTFILLAVGVFVYRKLVSKLCIVSYLVGLSDDIFLEEDGTDDEDEPLVDPQVWQDPCWQSDPAKFRELYNAILTGVKETQSQEYDLFGNKHKVGGGVGGPAAGDSRAGGTGSTTRGLFKPSNINENRSFESLSAVSGRNPFTQFNPRYRDGGATYARDTALSKNVTDYRSNEVEDSEMEMLARALKLQDSERESLSSHMRRQRN